jgi:tetratricopeptide (TPR) repeat protein
MATLSISDDGIKADGLMARVVDWVFGYDFFLSYSHGDGMRLPRRIKERLEHAGFRVFLDQTEYVAGEDLRRETRRQVVKSRKIVIVARASALKSEWVKREVGVALEHDKIPVIVNVNGAVEAAPRDAALAAMARERHWLRLDEALDDPDGEPTDRAISELVRGFHHTRQETKRQRIFATAAAVLALTAGVATWQAIEANRARAVAEAQRDRAQRVLDQVVGNANRRVESFSQRIKQEREPPRTDKAIPIRVSHPPEPSSQSPLQQAEHLVTMGATLLAGGDFRGSRSSLEEALRIVESRPDNHSPDPQWQLARFNVYNGLAKAALKGDDQDAAVAALTKAMVVAQERAAAEPQAAQWRQKLAILHQRIGELYVEQERLAEALEQYRAGAALWRELASVPELSPLARQQLAFSLGQLGDLEMKRRNIEQALTFYKDSVSALEQLAAAVTPGTDLQRDLSVGYQQIADALLVAGRAGEAIVWVDKDLAISQRTAADAPPSQQRDLASSYDRRARALEQLGRNAEALDAYGKGVSLVEAAAAADGAEPSWHRDAAAMIESMGKLLGKMGRRERAISLLRRALSIRESLAASLEEPEWQAEVEAAYRRISELMRSIDREDEALETAEQYLLATSSATDADKSKAERIARALGTLCWSALLAKNFPRAIWAGQHAVDLDPELNWVRSNYAHALMLSGQRQKAREIYLGYDSPSPHAAKQWKDQILKDFEEMKKRRIEDSLMGEISALLAAD